MFITTEYTEGSNHSFQLYFAFTNLVFMTADDCTNAVLSSQTRLLTVHGC